MIPKDGINMQYITGALLRRFWYIVVPFFLVSLIAITYALKAPKIYKAQTLILVEPQKVPREYVRSTVTVDLADRLRTITQQVKSRTRLESIIKKHDLYAKIRARTTMTDAVEVFRDKIQINVRSAVGSGAASFEIAFVNGNPTKVRDITNAIANLFIEDNLRLREAQAAGTTRFLDGELERMKEVLRQKEEQVRQFKEKYVGLLPEQMENNHRILSQLQRQLDSVNTTIQQTEDRKFLVQTQVGRLETVQASTAETTIPQQPLDSGAVRTPLSPEELYQQLEGLTSRYSEKHPDVVRVRFTIAKLEKEQALANQTADTEQTVAPHQSRTERLMLAQREDLLTQLKLINKEIRMFQEEHDKISGEIELYRQRIEEAPKIEQMFVDLRRGYREANENYQSLLEKKLQAQLAQNLEKTQQGEQFRILDPAKMPDKPFKPNPRKILALGFLLALACGLGLAYVRELMDSTFWDSKSLQNIVKLPVIVSVPVVNTRREIRWNWVKRVGAVGALASMACVLLYALFVLWKTDPGLFPVPLG